MGWRDMIVRSQPAVHPAKDRERNTVDTPASSLSHAEQKATDTNVVTSVAHHARPLTPFPPLLPGWFVVYRGPDGRLCGGADDREHGTVQDCPWDGRAFTTVLLTNGHLLPLRAITNVRAGDTAWNVREHGYDGEGRG
jgi:hypothetical protein